MYIYQCFDIDKRKLLRCSKLDNRSQRVRERNGTVSLLIAVGQPTRDCSYSCISVKI